MPGKIDSNNFSMAQNSQKSENAKFGNLESEASSPVNYSRKRVFFSRFKRKVLKHVWLLRILIIFGVFLVFSLLVFLTNLLLRNTRLGFYTDLIGNFVFTPAQKVKSIGERTDILILGKGGKGHEAPDLTDTMIFASIKHEPSSKPFGIGGLAEITMVSLPRDIWIYDLRAKLNSVYYWGNQKKPGDGGLVLAKSVVEEIVGQPVQYSIVIDFSGFKQIVDILGGINVDVAHSFTDNKYPIAGRENDECSGDPEYKCRYESIKFDTGIQYMDGETALKFVRSRNSEGEEGTDLARAARQERVIQAIKEKALSKEILLNPKKILELKNAILSSIETDITPQEAAVLARWFIQAKSTSSSYILSGDFLEVPPKSPKYDNLYVFVPKEPSDSDPSGRSWVKVHGWVKCVLEKGKCN